MKRVGTFKIETSFNITDRGIVVLGQIIEGIPKVGSYISIDISGKEETIKIIGTQNGNPDENGIVKFGLLLKIDNPLRINHIAENKLKEQVAPFFENSQTIPLLQ